MTNSLTSALIALVFLFFILRLLTGAKLPTHIGRPRTADGSGRGPALPRLRSGDSRASAGVFAVAAAAWSIAEGTSVVHSETPKVAALAGLAIGLMWVWPGVRWWLGAIFGVLGTLASVGSMFSFHPLGQGGLCELDEPDATWPIFLVIIVAMGMGALPMLRRIGLTGIRPVPGAREGRGLLMTDQSSGRAAKAFLVFIYHLIPDTGFLHLPCMLFRALLCVSSPFATISFKCLSSALITSSAVFP